MTIDESLGVPTDAFRRSPSDSDETGAARPADVSTMLNPVDQEDLLVLEDLADDP